MARKKTETLVEVVDLPKLPGIEMIDEGRLDEAVSHLNHLCVTKGLEMACGMGDYILKTFFKGKFENFHKWGSKHSTFKALMEREDTHFSASGLWYSVRIAEQVKSLPDKEIAMALPPTHHKMLTSIKDEDIRAELAEQAVSENMSSRDFQELVRENREEFSSGRPPLPAFAKGMKQLLKAVDIATKGKVNEGSFEHYKVKDAKALVRKVNTAIEKLEKTKADVEAQILSMS